MGLVWPFIVHSELGRPVIGYFDAVASHFNATSLRPPLHHFCQYVKKFAVLSIVFDSYVHFVSVVVGSIVRSFFMDCFADPQMFRMVGCPFVLYNVEEVIRGAG